MKSNAYYTLYRRLKIADLKMTFFVLFTNAIETEGRVDIIWNAIPGFPNEFGKAGVHGLPVFVISVAAAARFRN